MELQENEENEEDNHFGLVWYYTCANVTVWKYTKYEVMNQIRINKIWGDLFFPLGQFMEKKFRKFNEKLWKFTVQQQGKPSLEYRVRKSVL